MSITKKIIPAICSLTIAPASICAVVMSDNGTNTNVGPISINITQNTLTMEVNQKSEKLQVTAEPEGASNLVTFSSSDETIATVDANGVVTAKASGVATIKATSTINPKAFDTCIVYVKEEKIKHVTGVEITAQPQTNYIGVNKQFQLQCKVLPEDATIKGVTWSTSDSSKLKINKNGLITGISETGGDLITITVTTDDQHITASIKLLVWDYVTISFDCDEHGTKEQPTGLIDVDKGTTWAQLVDKYPKLSEDGLPESRAWFVDGYYDNNGNKPTNDYKVNNDTTFTYRFTNSFVDNNAKYSTLNENDASLDYLPDVDEFTVPLTAEHNSSTFNVTEIGNKGEAATQKLRTLTLTENIKKIGENSFAWTKLVNVNIPSNSQLTTFAGGAFSKSALSNIDFRRMAFLEYIGEYAFNDCSSSGSSYHEWTVPASLQYIGDHAFYHWSLFEKIDLSSCTNLSYIGDYAFERVQCALDLNMVIFNCAPQAHIGKGVFNNAFMHAITFAEDCPITSFPDEFLKNCKYLTNLTIPAGITNIGVDALVGCVALPEIINFAGTREQYRAIIRPEVWHPDQVTTVQCSDGTVGIDDK